MAQTAASRPVFFFDIDNCVWPPLCCSRPRRLTRRCTKVVSSKYVLLKMTIRRWSSCARRTTLTNKLLLGKKVHDLMQELIGKGP